MTDTVTDKIEEGRKTKIAEFRNKLYDLDAELIPLGEKEILTEAEQARWEELCTERDVIEPEYRKLEERLAKVDDIRTKAYREIRGMPEARTPVKELFGRDVTRMEWREARDGVLRIMDDKEQNYPLNARQLDGLDQLVRTNSDVARRVIVTENEHYRSAWFKTMRDPHPVFTAEEHEAMLRYQTMRTQDEATTHGGFAIPVFIDPSVILTDQELDNPFMRICRVENISTNAWKGVSAAGVSWSFDQEKAEVSDDSITLAQPSVTVYTARGFIPYSIEIGDDWPGFQAEMARLLAEGYNDLLLSKFTSGNGTSEPKGILTALTAQTTTETTVTTDGLFGQEDIYKLWAALGQKYRQRASFMMSVGTMNKIRQFGAANVYHATTITLTEGAIENLFSKPVYENAYMTDFSGTTGQAQLVVAGDFKNYLIAKRTGMEVELVPHLFHTSTNLPMGARGWFAHARIGGSVVNNSGFQCLINT